MTVLSVDRINVNQLQHLQAQSPNLPIRDVRTGAEFEVAHISGAYNIPLETLVKNAQKLAEVAHPVVVVCQSGTRSTKACENLVAVGKTNLQILDGGLVAWQTSGGDVVNGGAQRWAMDRQVRFVAGALIIAGLLCSIVIPQAKWVVGVVGAGLVYSAISNTCTMATVLAKLPYNRTEACDVSSVVTELNKG